MSIEPATSQLVATRMLVSIRPGQYTAAVIENPDGTRSRTGWHVSNAMLNWSIEQRTSPKTPGARVVYLLRCTIDPKSPTGAKP